MDPEQFEEIFLNYLSQASPHSVERGLQFAHQAEISYFMDLSSLQDSFRFRARYLSWKIGGLLIDERGEIQTGILSNLLAFFSKTPFCLGPRKEGDSLIYAHLLDCFTKLETDPSIWRLIRKFSVPLCHKRAEEIVRETLWPSLITKVETVHVRRAALVSWLTFLRQTVGSCFATAPAILIQKQPQLFFKDLYELLTTGQMKRILLGKEYAVPLSLNPGKMDLQKPFVFSERISFSPGLISALESANLFPAHFSIQAKVAQLRKAILDLKDQKNPDSLIRTLLLNSADLTQKDLDEEEAFQKMQMTPMLARSGSVYYQKPTIRGQKIADWKKRSVKATTAFEALTECSLLRSWEYTIASLSDIKVDFARWNLYVGLGLRGEEKGGLAEFLYKKIDEHLQKSNQEIVRLQKEYESARNQVYALQALAHRSSGDAQSYQFRGELSAALHSAQVSLELRDQFAKKSEALSQFFSTLIHFYAEHLILHFQEIFDPSVATSTVELYEDSPAGFRLLYKHGRRDASLWTLIYTSEEYIQTLSLFFASVENEFVLPQGLDRSFFSQITTQIIQFIQTPQFLSAAIDRSKADGKSTPWNYLSGGTMQTLLQAYVGRSHPFTELSFLPKSEIELLRVLLHLKKEIKEPVLIHSPTHAFVLHLEMLAENSESLLLDSQKTLSQWKLNEEQQEYLAHLLSEKLASSEKALFLHRFRQKPVSQTISQFRLNILDSLQNIESLSSSAIDSFLYENIPVKERAEIYDALESILMPLCKIHSLSTEKIDQLITKQQQNLMSAEELIEAAKTIVLQLIKTPFSSVDWDKEIIRIARQLKLCYPHLVLFADTNWSGWFFGFVWNISTQQIELWRLNRTGSKAVPMNDWKIWFQPENKIPWVVLSRPQEYNSRT